MLNCDLPGRDAFRLPLGFDPAEDGFQLPDPGDAVHADTLFFAVLPPPATAASIARLARDLRDKHGLTGKLLRPESLHVSLLFAGYHGRMPPQTLDALIEAAGTVVMPWFRVGFDRVVSFRNTGKRPLVLGGDDGVSGLIWLRDRLVAATMDVAGGIPTARGAFTPHLTLLYDEADIGEEPVEDISWTVSEFVLVRSHFGQGRHSVLRRWKLRG